MIPSTQGRRNEKGIERVVGAEALIMVVSNLRGLDFRVNPARDTRSSVQLRCRLLRINFEHYKTTF